MDDQRIGSGLRAIRIRRGLRHRDLASAARVPRGVLTLVEHGRLDEVRFGHVRQVAKALDVRFEGLIRWQGGDLDRLTNRGHARMHEAMARWFAELEVGRRFRKSPSPTTGSAGSSMSWPCTPPLE